MDGSKEVLCGPVISGGDRTELLEFSEEVFDQAARHVAMPVESRGDRRLVRGGITAMFPAAASGSRTRSSASNALSAISDIGPHRGQVDDRRPPDRMPRRRSGESQRMLENPLPRARLGPATESPVYVLPVTESLAIEHRFNEQPVVRSGHPDQALLSGQEVLDPLPLVVARNATSVSSQQADSFKSKKSPRRNLLLDDRPSDKTLTVCPIAKAWISRELMMTRIRRQQSVLICGAGGFISWHIIIKAEDGRSSE
jgi:hypothetical protein